MSVYELVADIRFPLICIGITYLIGIHLTVESKILQTDYTAYWYIWILTIQ